MKAERIILFFYCAINCAQYLIVNYTGLYIADAFGAPVSASRAEQFGIMLATQCACILAYLFYKRMVAGRPKRKPDHTNRLEFWLILALTLTFSGTLFLDYGRAEVQSSSPYGFIFRIIPTDLLFMFFFCTARLDKGHTWFLTATYVSMKVWMGWTGMISGIFWVIFIRFINFHKHKPFIASKGVVLLLILFFAAPFVYSVKFYVRWADYDFNYYAVMVKLIGRMGFYSNSLYIWENSEQLANQALYSLSYFSYARDAVVSVLPRSLLGLQGQNLETEFVRFVAGDYNPGVTFYLGLLGKSIVYAEIHAIEITLMLSALVLLVILTFKLSHKCIGSQANPILYLWVFQILLSGSMEEVSYNLYATTVIYVLSRTRLQIEPRGFSMPTTLTGHR